MRISHIAYRPHRQSQGACEQVKGNQEPVVCKTNVTVTSSSRRVLGLAFEGMDVTFFATENCDEPLALSLTLAASPPLPQSLTSASLEPSSELGFSPDS